MKELKKKKEYNKGKDAQREKNSDGEKYTSDGRRDAIFKLVAFATINKAIIYNDNDYNLLFIV